MFDGWSLENKEFNNNQNRQPGQAVSKAMGHCKSGQKIFHQEKMSLDDFVYHVADIPFQGVIKASDW